VIAAGIDADERNGLGETCLTYLSANSNPGLVELPPAQGAGAMLKKPDVVTALDLVLSVERLRLLRKLKLDQA
jgi:hypothetical protein